MLLEYQEHISKIKELLALCTEIAEGSSEDSIILSDYNTPPVSIIENSFGPGKLTNIGKSVGLREAYDFISSYERIKFFYDLDRDFFYETAPDEYEMFEKHMDFHSASLARMVKA